MLRAWAPSNVVIIPQRTTCAAPTAYLVISFWPSVRSVRRRLAGTTRAGSQLWAHLSVSEALNTAAVQCVTSFKQKQKLQQLLNQFEIWLLACAARAARCSCMLLVPGWCWWQLIKTLQGFSTCVGCVSRDRSTAQKRSGKG